MFYTFVVWEFAIRPLIKLPCCVLLQSQLSSSCVAAQEPGTIPVLASLQAVSLGAVPRCGQDEDLGFAACSLTPG